MQKKLIIFDMDGTLIDSGNVITNTINFVRRNLGLKPIPKAIMLQQINNPDINAAEYFYGTSAFTDEQTELFTRYYDQHCISDIELYEGIEDMLKILQTHFKLTIATNASVEFAQKMIEHLNIDHYFDMIIGANCVENPKPHPDMILKTIESFDTHKKEVILIGDSHKDKRAAQNADIDCFLVNWGFTDHSEDDVFTSSFELMERLLEYKV